MPTYDYRCSSCGERVEIVHSIQGGPPETCPSCGAFGTLRKAFAPPAIHFKGTGWAKKERHASAARSRSASASADSGSESGAESGGERAKAEPSAGPSEGAHGTKATSGSDRSGGDRGGGDRGGSDRGGDRKTSAGKDAAPKAEPAGR